MTENELDVLKARADAMGIKYKDNIGIEALKNKINHVLANDGKPEELDDEDGPKAKPAKHETEQQIRDRMQRDEMALVRVRINCMNPLKATVKGEFVTVANKFLGTVRKFVPYAEGSENGYHIPKVLYDELKARKFNHITTRKGPNGQVLPVQRLVPEFTIEVLEPLSQAELDKLAAQQRAAAGLD